VLILSGRAVSYLIIRFDVVINARLSAISRLRIITPRVSEFLRVCEAGRSGFGSEIVSMRQCVRQTKYRRTDELLGCGLNRA
jgi:hypothetical protein